MDPSVFPDIGSETVRVGGIQLCILSVVQDLLNHRIIRGKFLQNIGRCGVTGLRLLSTFDLHFFEQDLAELFRGVDVKLLSGHLPDLLLEDCNLFL